MLLDIIPDAFEVHGHVMARPSSVGTFAPLAIPTGRWTSDDIIPEAGTTFSWVKAPCFHGWTIWLREEDREQSKADSKRLDKILGALTKAELSEVCRELGCSCPPTKRRDLVLDAKLRQMDRWWPWEVAA